MITYNNPKDTERRSNVDPPTMLELEYIAQTINNFVPANLIQTRGNIQRLLDHHANLQHFYDNAGGWEGLAKLQETADGKGWISVGERLPEEEQQVIVWHKNDYEHAIFRKGKFQYIQGVVGLNYKNVTKWAILPGPPTE